MRGEYIEQIAAARRALVGAMRGLAGSIAVIVVSAHTVRAHPPPPPPAPHEPSRVVELGPWFAAELVDHYSGLALGARLDLGVVRGAMTYELDAVVGHVWLLTKDEQDLHPTIGGTYGRAGATARWVFGSIGGSDFRVEGWLEGGVGVHAIQWHASGRLVRPDALGGLGFSERIGRSQRYSLDIGLDVVIGAPRGSGVPTCAGPCDEPTPPVHPDVGVVDHVTFTARW
jgi:hypothetical protein